LTHKRNVDFKCTYIFVIGCVVSVLHVTCGYMCFLRFLANEKRFNFAIHQYNNINGKKVVVFVSLVGYKQQ